MSNNHKKGPGGHYSGANPIPNIQGFVESLDKDKKERDKKVEEQMKARTAQGKDGGDAIDHKPDQPSGVMGTRKTVTDPTTGREVEIEDVNADFMKSVDNPQVGTPINIPMGLADIRKLSVPNANIGKDTPVKTEATQSGEEYKNNQDITAPPDPIEPGSTSDVPIHGEKTNILFHPTPPVSYEPMFEALEKLATVLCGGVFIAIVVLGKMFGGALYGLIPLAMCITSGILVDEGACQSRTGPRMAQ